MKNNENKNLFLGVAAATALVGAALIYHLVFSEDDGEEAGAGGIMAELTAAGLEEVKKAANGQGLEPQYMLKMLQFVSVTAK